MKGYKILLIFLIYFLPISLAANLVIKTIKTNSDKNEDIGFYKKLKEVGYLKEAFNPYKKVHIIDVHPQYGFGLPLRKKDRTKRESKYVKFNNEGYRKTTNNSNKKIYSKNGHMNCLLILGGSTAFGSFVSSDQNTIASNIQTLIDKDTRVFNLGVPSFVSRQELTSVMNFFNQPISKKCLTINSISFTTSNDISNIEKLIENKIVENKYDRIGLLSTSKYYSFLEDKLLNSELKNSYKDLFGSLVYLTQERLYGDLYREFRKITWFKFNKYKKIETQNSKKIGQDYINTASLPNYKKLSSNQLVFIDEQIKSFINMQSYISMIIEDKGKGIHMTVIQPDLRWTRSFWSIVNQSLSKNVLENQNLEVLDLRNIFQNSLKKLSIENLPLSLKHSYQKSKESINSKNINKFDMFDNVHLTDIGSLKVSKKIYKRYKTLLTTNFN